MQLHPNLVTSINEYQEVEATKDAAYKARKRAANELSNPQEVQRIIRQQEQARDAEQLLDQAGRSINLCRKVNYKLFDFKNNDRSRKKDATFLFVNA